LTAQLLRPNLRDKQSYTDVMLAELDRLEQISTELSLLSRPQFIAFEKQDLHAILGQVRTLMYTQSILNNVEINLSYRAEAKYIDGDKNRLKQVFINLLKNAIEAMPDDGGTIHIDVTDKTDGDLFIRVIDDGEGITAEDLKKMEQPFYTTKTEENRPGDHDL